MDIEVNGEWIKFDYQVNLKTVVQSILTETKGIAVAVNNSVIPKPQWEQKILLSKDRVLLIKATQGG